MQIFYRCFFGIRFFLTSQIHNDLRTAFIIAFVAVFASNCLWVEFPANPFQQLRPTQRYLLTRLQYLTYSWP